MSSKTYLPFCPGLNVKPVNLINNIDEKKVKIVDTFLYLFFENKSTRWSPSWISLPLLPACPISSHVAGAFMDPDPSAIIPQDL